MSLVFDLTNDVADADRAGFDDFGICSAASLLHGYGAANEPQCGIAKPRCEFDASGVRLRSDFDHGRSDLEAGAYWQVVMAKVDVYDELVACEFPS